VRTSPSTAYGRSLLPVLVLVLLFAGACASSGDPTATGASEPLGADTEPPTTAPIPVPTQETGDDVVSGAESADQPEAPAETVEATSPADVDPLACLTPRQRIGQLLMPLLTQPELPAAHDYAARGELGGVTLLGSPNAQIASDLLELQDAASPGLPVMVASDEEGGDVQRFAALLGALPSAATQARTQSAEQVRSAWVVYGTALEDLGIDVVFGPVLDVGSAPGIASRSFGDDPDVVTEFGRAVAGGLLEAGVMPVFKHFPGHGRASADSHEELPTTPPIDELRALDLVPYDRLLTDPLFAEQAAVMVGHLSVPDLSGDYPTSLSPNTVAGLLRGDGPGEYGFDGLVFTDAMGMGAIVNRFDRLDAIEMALQAGSDIAILGSLADLTPVLDHLEARVAADPEFAAIIDQHVMRVLAAKDLTNFCGAQ